MRSVLIISLTLALGAILLPSPSSARLTPDEAFFEVREEVSGVATLRYHDAADRFRQGFDQWAEITFAPKELLNPLLSIREGFARALVRYRNKAVRYRPDTVLEISRILAQSLDADQNGVFGAYEYAALRISQRSHIRNKLWIGASDVLDILAETKGYFDRLRAKGLLAESSTGPTVEGMPISLVRVFVILDYIRYSENDASPFLAGRKEQIASSP